MTRHTLMGIILVGLLPLLAGGPDDGGNSPVSDPVSDSMGTVVPARLYVANQGSGNISTFAINTTTGALTAITGSPFAAGTSPTGVAIPGKP